MGDIVNMVTSRSKVDKKGRYEFEDRSGSVAFETYPGSIGVHFTFKILNRPSGMNIEVTKLRGTIKTARYEKS